MTSRYSLDAFGSGSRQPAVRWRRSSAHRRAAQAKIDEIQSAHTWLLRILVPSGVETTARLPRGAVRPCRSAGQKQWHPTMNQWPHIYPAGRPPRSGIPGPRNYRTTEPFPIPGPNIGGCHRRRRKRGARRRAETQGPSHVIDGRAAVAFVDPNLDPISQSRRRKSTPRASFYRRRPETAQGRPGAGAGGLLRPERPPGRRTRSQPSAITRPPGSQQRELAAPRPTFAVLTTLPWFQSQTLTDPSTAAEASKLPLGLRAKVRISEPCSMHGSHAERRGPRSRSFPARRDRTRVWPRDRALPAGRPAA